jgi:hypothetical protein
MKVAEILSEMQRGQIYKGGVSYDKSAPWIKNQMDVAAERTKTIDQLEDPAAKFKFIADLGSNAVRNKVFVKLDDGDKLVPMTIKSYDPDTGNIFLGLSGNSLKTYRTNVSTLDFIGRERSPSTSVKTYKFAANVTGSEEKQSKNKLLIKKREEEAAKQAAEKERLERQQQFLAHRRRDQEELMRGISNQDYDDPWGYRR